MAYRKFGCAAFAVLILASTAFAEGTSRSITLDEAFALSLKRSETIAINQASYKEALARVDDMASYIKPTLDFLASDLFQDTAHNNSNNTSSSNALNQRSRPQVNLHAHQPLFSGFREFLAYKAAKRQGESAQLDLQRAQDLLYQDVAQAYLNLLGIQKEIQIRQATEDISSKRIKDLMDWERIGRSRHSEVLAAQTQLAQLDTDLIRARSSEADSQEALQFLTGLNESLAPQDTDFPPSDPLDALLSQAQQRSDVKAREKDYNATQLTSGVYRRARWPVIAADGNYYFKRPEGSQHDIKWDALLSLDLPLYSGGAISAQVREAEAREESAQQNLSLARRRAESEVRTSAQDLAFTLDMVQSLKKAEKFADENIKQEAVDYRHGQVTNLDVLSTLSSYQEIRLSLNQTNMAAVFNRVRLGVAAGRSHATLPAGAVGQPDQTLSNGDAGRKQ